MGEMVIFFCKKCGAVFGGESNVKRSCSDCDYELMETNVSRDYWRRLSDNDKEELKKQWMNREIESDYAYVYYTALTDLITYNKYLRVDDISLAIPQRSYYTGYTKAQWESMDEQQQNKIKAELTSIISAHCDNIFVTTGDWHEEYEVVSPVYYQISNRGLFTDEVTRKSKEYSAFFENKRRAGVLGETKADWGFLYGNYDVGSTYFEKAFYIATEEIKARAYLLGADAVICMRHDIDIETEHINNFYLQMYGTAIKIKKLHK